MLISVIIPVYNAEGRLKNTVHSLLNQNTDKIEIILVNDGSKDGSKEICDYYAERYGNIKVIHQINAGPSVARNRGLQEAAGKYITFVDADDQVKSNWYNVISRVINNDNPELIISGYNSSTLENNNLIIGNSKNSKSRVVEGNTNSINLIEELIGDSTFNPLWNKVYLAKTIKKNNVSLNPEYRMGEDFLFNLEFFNYVEKIVIIEDPLYNYIINLEGLTRSYIPNKFERLLGVTLEFKNFLIKHGDSLSCFYERLLRNVYSSTMEMFHKDCKLSKEDKLNSISQILNNNHVNELIKGYKPDNLKQKILVCFLKSNNSSLIYYISKRIHAIKFKK